MPPGRPVAATFHDVGRRVPAVLKGHLHPQAPEIDPRITSAGCLPVDQATQRSPSHSMLPPQTSPCRNTDRAAGAPCDLRARRPPAVEVWSAFAPPAFVGAVVNSTGPGPVWYVVLSLQAEGVDSGNGGSCLRSRATETLGGRSALPDKNVSKV